MTNQDNPQTTHWRLVRRKECWVLTWRGWIVVGLMGTVLATSFAFGAYPFLAVTHRVPSRFLVVEGWLPNYALEACIQEFKTNRYEAIITVGGKTMNGTNLEPGDSIANEAAKKFKWLGLNPEVIRVVASTGTYRDRTFKSGAALRQYFAAQQTTNLSVNVVTLGPHGRRSRLLFEQALGESCKVGIISVPTREYESACWWRSSEGVREMISEILAYLYARLIFTPADASNQ